MLLRAAKARLGFGPVSDPTVVLRRGRSGSGGGAGASGESERNDRVFSVRGGRAAQDVRLLSHVHGEALGLENVSLIRRYVINT